MVQVSFKDFDTKSDKDSSLLKNVVKFMQEQYQTIRRTNNGGSAVVFCIHGNKWGMANCCEDLDIPVTRDKDILINCDSLDREDDTCHSYCHTSKKEGVDKRARRKLVVASVLCLVFMLGEVVGGVLSNSLAIATDAAHLLTDFASFMISLLAIWMAARPTSQKMSYGWHRAEVLGATLSVLMIWLVTGILVYTAVNRVITGDHKVEAKAMLITSGLGVLVNIIMGAILHQHGHGHGGGHSHDTEAGHSPVPPGGEAGHENINVKAAFIHVIGDFLQSLGVFTAALIIYFYPDYSIIDPICTFIFGILVLATTVSILRNTIEVLMEATPNGISHNLVKSTLLGVSGIKKVHNLHIWSLTTDKTALSAHLVIEQGLHAQKVLTEATRQIRAQYSLYEMTLQVEELQPDMEGCNEC